MSKKIFIGLTLMLVLILAACAPAATEAPAEEAPVVVVGKAITFDTGGYSLKDTKGIVGMKLLLWP